MKKKKPTYIRTFHDLVDGKHRVVTQTMVEIEPHIRSISRLLAVSGS
jgi:hypothetical protein